MCRGGTTHYNLCPPDALVNYLLRLDGMEMSIGILVAPTSERRERCAKDGPDDGLLFGDLPLKVPLVDQVRDDQVVGVEVNRDGTSRCLQSFLQR